MDQSTRELVWRRAQSMCEYCRWRQVHSSTTFEIDHIIALKHHGATVPENLALACLHCNSNKGPNLAGVDPETGRIARLFHPRKDRWNKHFLWEGPYLKGLTSIGRATIAVLEMNHFDYVSSRAVLIAAGEFPPDESRRSDV